MTYDPTDFIVRQKIVLCDKKMVPCGVTLHTILNKNHFINYYNYLLIIYFSRKAMERFPSMLSNKYPK